MSIQEFKCKTIWFWTQMRKKYLRKTLYVLVPLLLFVNFFAFGVNLSSSLPESLYLVTKYDRNVHKNDYVAFRWFGGLYADNARFVKIVAGEPGDIVSRKGREFFINGASVGIAKTVDSLGKPLVATSFVGKIPPGKYWVRAPHKDSLDSRYEISGLVSKGQIIGKVYVIF